MARSHAQHTVPWQRSKMASTFPRGSVRNLGLLQLRKCILDESQELRLSISRLCAFFALPPSPNLMCFVCYGGLVQRAIVPLSVYQCVGVVESVL